MVEHFDGGPEVLDHPVHGFIGSKLVQAVPRPLALRDQLGLGPQALGPQGTPWAASPEA
jgi:hypothetical protein